MSTWREYRGHEIYLISYNYYVVGMTRSFHSIHAARRAIDDKISIAPARA